MTKPSRALLAALPLLWSSVAFAEQTPPPCRSEPPLSQQELTAQHANECDEHYARRSGDLGYQEALFRLTEPQKAAFAKYRQDSLAAAEAARTACRATPPKLGVKPTAIDRVSHKEAQLKLELQSLQEIRPALEAFYATLTPDQKEIFDREPANPPGPKKEGHGKRDPSDRKS